MLGAAGDLGRDVHLVQLPLELAGCRLDVVLAVVTPLGHHRRDLLVLAGMKGLEGEILELPLDGVDAEPVRERRVDLQRLLRLLDLLLLAEILDRPHVVQSVGELDQDDADVLRHRHDHLPVVLDLGLLAALEGNPRQLGDTLDQLRDLVPELALDLVERRIGVLDDVVEERCGQRGFVEAELRADLGHAEGMANEVLPRAPLLALVRLGCKGEGSLEQPPVDLRLVGLDIGDQLLQEGLMPFGCFEDRHQFSVLPRSAATLLRDRRVQSPCRRNRQKRPEVDRLASTPP